MSKYTELIELATINDNRGDLSVVEEGINYSFPIMRVYWLYNLPKGLERGGHAHKKLKQLLIAMHGTFSIITDDGENSEEYVLDRPNKALYIKPITWRVIKPLTDNAVLAVFVSELYDEYDYIRTYTEFTDRVKGNQRFK